MKNWPLLALLSLVLLSQGCHSKPRADENTDKKTNAGKDYPFPDSSTSSEPS